MLKAIYQQRIADIVQPLLRGKRVGVFLFGSSVRNDRFGDCDIGLQGEVDEEVRHHIQEALTESTSPYTADVVNFNTVSAEFKQHVFQQPILWIQREA